MMKDYLILEENFSLGFLKLFATKEIDQQEVGMHIDITNNILKISNHLSSGSSTAKTYYWPIIETNLIQGCYFEVPAKVFINILEKLGVQYPISVTLLSERKFELASHITLPYQQMSLFDSDEIPRKPKLQNEIDYYIDVSPCESLTQYHQAQPRSGVGYLINHSDLRRMLSMVCELSKEGNNNRQKSEIILSPEFIDDRWNLNLFSNSLGKSCSLNSKVNLTRQSIETPIQNCHISFECMKLLNELASVLPGNIRIETTKTRIIVSQGNCVCSFSQSQNTWDGQKLAQELRFLDLELFTSMSLQDLPYTLPKLNVANEKKKARLILRSDPGSTSTTLSISQDHGTSKWTTDLPLLSDAIPEPLTLSLWSFEKVINYYRGQDAYFYFDAQRRRLIFTDKTNCEYIVLKFEAI
ncbi:hypothetical protein L4D20_03655 [Vibrio kyushuensis]|uniref:hypothetical protein n=1 Tax=Vibrio kyushuensis TaxID=2910249 RepID=UPI003D0DE94F